MAASYKPGGKKTNVWVWVVTIIFLLIATALIVTVNLKNVVAWMKVSGTALGLLIAVPCLSVLFKIIIKKIKGI